MSEILKLHVKELAQLNQVAELANQLYLKVDTFSGEKPTFLMKVYYTNQDQVRTAVTGKLVTVFDYTTDSKWESNSVLFKVENDKTSCCQYLHLNELVVMESRRMQVFEPLRFGRTKLLWEMLVL